MSLNREQRRNAKHGRYDPAVILEQDRQSIEEQGQTCICKPFVMPGRGDTYIAQHSLACMRHRDEAVSFAGKVRHGL